MNKNNKIIFDVESTSLHGEAFAVGAIVVDECGFIIDEFERIATDVAEKANDWVKEHVLPNLFDMTPCKTGREMRDAFYEFYLKHKNTAEVWSDCNFPVETNFLSAIANDDIENREFGMPYPLYDVCSFVPICIDRYLESEKVALRRHHPLHDSIASFDCLVKSDFYKKFKNK